MVLSGDIMDRETILNNFFNKINTAKRMNNRDIRMTVKELEEVGEVIRELLTSFYNKIETFQDSLKPGEVKVVPFSNEEIKMDGGSFE